MSRTITILVTVKAYPQLSSKYGETVCVAGVRTDTEKPEWVRLYPVVYRDLHYDLRFSKYQYITVDVSDANDPRPESLRPNLDTLKLGPTLEAGDWRERRRIVEPLMVESMCGLLGQQERDGTSLGVFRPASVDDLVIEAVGDGWDASKQGIADQPSLFFPGRASLEKIPYRFLYVYRCAELSCPGHRQSIVDWEIGQLYRGLRDRGDDDAVALRKIRDKWLKDMCAPERDTAFFVGNHLKNPQGFMVLGVFWPPRR
jgi:hypothetical protein